MRKTVAMQYGGKKTEKGTSTAGSISVAASLQTDETLNFTDGVLSVNTAKEVAANNTLPITAAAVYTEVGNIETLLKTI